MSKNLYSKDNHDQRFIQSLEKWILPELYHTDGGPSTYGIKLCKNTWSKRLCGGVKLLIPGCNISFTGNDGSKFGIKQEKETGLESNESTCRKCYRRAVELPLLS